jgi:DNA-binding CsgD family transcriptional regulator
VHQGQIWADNQQMGLVVQAFASSHNPRAVDAQGVNLLSKREMEVVRSVAQGLTNREIAERLGLSQHTVKNYLFRVFDKLGVSSRVELLFMTLSRDRQSQSAFSCFLKNSTDVRNDSIFVECQRAAEQGVPIAPLALAHLYWTRRAGSKDLLQAYKWYLIANEQTSRTSKSVGEAMTMEQLLQAEQMAAEWLKKTQKLPPSLIGDVTDRPPAMGQSAAAD